MNIQIALNQMRIARRLGKISNEIQSRTLRRLGYAPAVAVSDYRSPSALLAPPTPQWIAMMGLLESIKAEIAPMLEAKRQAERECYDIRFAGDGQRKEKISKVTPVVRPPKQDLLGYEYTRAWWDAMDLKEKADRMAARAELATA